MKIKCVVFMIAAALLSQTARASVGGAVLGGTVPGNPVGFNPCGSAGTVYNNQTPSSMRLEVSLTNFGACNTSFSWTDAAGNPQSISIAPNASTVISSSLAANSSVLWVSPATSGFVNFLWEIEQAPAQSVGMPAGFGSAQLGNTPCGSAGTLYKNLTGVSTTLNLSVTNDLQCTFAVSWTNSSGEAQTISLGLGESQGVSIILPAGGLITWTSGSGSAPINAGWRLERRVLASMNP